MQFLEESINGAKARERLRWKFQKKGLEKQFFVAGLLSEEEKGKRFRARLKHGMKILGLKRLPLLWALEKSDEDPEAKAVVTKLAQIIIRCRKWLYGAPDKFSGGLLLNILGFQVFRAIFYSFSLHLRRKPKIFPENESLAKELEHEGIVIIENFLPADHFEEIKKDFAARESQFQVFYQDDSVKKSSWRKFTAVSGTYEMGPLLVHSPVATKLLIRHPKIYQCIAAAARRPIHLDPELAYFEWKVQGDLVGKLHQFDYEDMSHYDVPYATFKVFYYLNDVDEKNGSFVYVRKSHKLTLTRLWFDYKLSVMYYLGWIKPNQHDNMADNLTKKLGLKEEFITGKANTLIIANTMGFHRRAVFESERPRQAAFMNFRHIDSWANIFAKNQQRELV